MALASAKRATSDAGKNSMLRTIAFAAAVAVVCGALVTLVSVLLAPAQSENRHLEQQRQLEVVLLNQPGFGEIANQNPSFSMVHQLVELATGCYNHDINPSDFAAATDPNSNQLHAKQVMQLSDAQDTAKIGVRAPYALTHLVMDGDLLVAVVLPVYGLGYQSRLSGYLTLSADGNKIQSLVFYEHKETPGMGGRISNKTWQEQWQDKQLRDPQGVVRIGVSNVSPTKAEDRPYNIDAMTGASITGRGVTNLLRFWVGPLGFGPYLENLQSQAPCINLTAP